MNLDILLPLPKDWTSETEKYIDDSGCEITHFAANLGSEDNFESIIDIYLGDMPDGETAEDQAYANYAETVGFYEDDPEDFNPIIKTKFNGKNAWGFDAVCDEDNPMRFLAQEVKQGVLAVIVFVCRSEDALEDLHKYIERNFRVK